MDEQIWLRSADPDWLMKYACMARCRACGHLWHNIRQDASPWDGQGAPCCNNPNVGFDWVLSDRKHRLFAAAACRLAWGRLGKRSREAVRVAEAYADGRATNKKLAAAREGAERAHNGAPDRSEEDRITGAALHDAWGCSYPDVRMSNRWILTPPLLAEAHVMADLLREVAGNLFRPTAFPPSREKCPWLTQAALQVAARAYGERDWAALPVLADALEEGGCDDEALLGHLRGPGPHVRGCWAVDCVLGKL